MMSGYGGSWMGSIFMIFIVLLVIIGIVLLIIWLVRSQGGKIRPGENRDPLDILKERYASGDITKTEFEEMKRDLEG